jgi:Holliday junction resolvase
MAKASKDKGKRGELEIANELKKRGYDARRGQQYCGSNGDADVTGLHGIHIEVKRTEALRLYEAMEQAKQDKKEDEIPIICHRRNKKKWLVVMELDDWIKLYESGGFKDEKKTILQPEERGRND